MANKPSFAEEFEKNLNDLDAELGNIQKSAEEIFQKMCVILRIYPINNKIL